MTSYHAMIRLFQDMIRLFHGMIRLFQDTQHVQKLLSRTQLEDVGSFDDSFYFLLLQRRVKRKA